MMTHDNTVHIVDNDLSFGPVLTLLKACGPEPDNIFKTIVCCGRGSEPDPATNYNKKMPYLYTPGP